MHNMKVGVSSISCQFFFFRECSSVMRDGNVYHPFFSSITFSAWVRRSFSNSWKNGSLSKSKRHRNSEA